MIIWSDDPRGVIQAMNEEREKDPNVQIVLKRRKPQLFVDVEPEFTEDEDE